MESLFTASRDRLPGAGKVAETRRLAFEAYERAGLPHRRIEEWKYTDLRALMREVRPLAEKPDAAALKRAKAALKPVAVAGATKLVLVDGVFAAELSDKAPAGVSVTTLREVLEGGAGDLLVTTAADVMISLNAALATDGVVVEVADGTKLAAPLQIIHVATVSSVSAVTRSQMKIGKGARVTLVENFVAAESAKTY